MTLFLIDEYRFGEPFGNGNKNLFSGMGNGEWESRKIFPAGHYSTIKLFYFEIVKHSSQKLVMNEKSIKK